MYVVAHEDDDLLFMNPDIARSIAAGNRVVIVHVTTGDLPVASVESFGDQQDPPDFTRYWIDRERGILNAFTAMARGPDAALPTYAPAGVLPEGWTAQLIDVAGVRMPEYDLVATSGQTIAAVFMRLSDFQLQGAWNDWPGASGQRGGAALSDGDTITDGCGDPAICPLGTVIPSQLVTREQLIETFTGLLARFDVDSVSAQDATTPTKGDSPSGMYWDLLGTPDASRDPWAGFTDYWDHVYTAAFVVVAASRAQAASPRTLSVRLYRDYTLSQEPPNLEDREALAKAQVFAYYGVFDASITPHYQKFDFAAPSFGGGDYDSSAAGSWQHRQLATRTLVGAGALQGRLAVAGSCVGTAGGSPALVPCDTAPSWIITATNQVQAAVDGGCLAVGDAGAIGLAACSPQALATTMFVFANGQVRTPDAQCLTAVGSTLASADCDHEPPAPHATGRVIASQDFTLLFERARALAVAHDATAVSLVHGRACVREPGRLACSAYADGELGAPVQLAAIAADANDVEATWDPSTETVVACGREGGVVTCGARTARDHARDLRIRYLDLTGRGALDVCGRTVDGLACSLDTGGAWGAARAWTAEFSDAEGWLAPAYGDTVQLADVDGDGRADACGRSPLGIDCAPQLDARFGEGARWSFDEDRTSDLAHTRPDFSDRDPDDTWAATDAYYGSLHFVDVNRDGLADACARGAAGIYCAFSTGTAFERKKLVLPDAFTDADGWAASAHGTSITWGDLDGNARIDVCGLGDSGMVCAEGY
jgi:hypothetical protein